MFNKLNFFCSGILRRASAVPARYWIVLFIVLWFGGRGLWKSAHRPAHLDAIAEEFGNMGFMPKDEGVLKNAKMRLNHAGDKLVFLRSSEKGVGIFLCDVVSGDKQMVFEEKEMCFGQGPHGVLKAYPWSPDDQRFVYGHQGAGAQNGDFDRANETVLTVHNADSGIDEGTVEIPYGQVAALDWLSPNAFVSASGVNGQDFNLIERQTDGHWQLKPLDKPVVGTNGEQVCSLAAISSNTVAWLQGTNIWTMNVFSNEVVNLTGLPAGGTYTAFDYSKETRQFLISCIDTRGDTLWRLSADDPQSIHKITTIAHTHSKLWNDAMWINGAKGMAYIVPWKNSEGFVTQAASGRNLTTYFKQQSIQYFTASPDGKLMYVVGDVTNQPGAAIWEFNVQANALRCLIPASEKPLRYSKYIAPRTADVQLPSDAKLVPVVIFPPADYHPKEHKKYPIVITSIGFAAAQPYITQYAEAVANAGAYFVIVDRAWNNRGEGIDNWETNVMEFYNVLREEPVQKRADAKARSKATPLSISYDKNRIFLLSNSAQSIGLVNLLSQNPGLCNGAIMLVPGGVSEPSKLVSLTGRPLKILVSQQDGRDEEHLKRDQEEAAKTGIDMDYIIHPGTPHEFIAMQSQRDRIKAMLHFIFDN